MQREREYNRQDAKAREKVKGRGWRIEEELGIGN